MDFKESFEFFTQKVKPARVMAVSKTRSIDEIMDAYNAGYRLFGENHVQEIVSKFGNGRPVDMELHMIGHLQSNKVNKVVPLVDMVESVDSFSLLEKINACSLKNSKITDVLLELNTSGESAKSGFASEKDLLACIAESADLANIRIRGLMTVGPVDCAAEDKDRLTFIAFNRLKELFDRCKKTMPPYFDILSMGMSGDYMIAVENGSTQVRIGTAVFGERHYD